MDSTLYWCWLQDALGCGARLEEVVAAFGTPAQLYAAGAYERRISGALTPKQIEKLAKTKLSHAQEILEQCKRHAIHVITPDSAGYPDMLRTLADFPAVLYVRGDPSVLQSRMTFAVVGARSASAEAVQAANAISFALAKAGMVIVSGGALGVDSAAHTGALEAGCKTVCYMGCGFGTRYLMQNSPLRKQIAQNGALVSEYPPGCPAGKSTFPIRNRLISGNSLGVLVMEAGVKSGSLITAQRALDQGRDVFAVPGSIVATSFDGANKLIRDGAKPVFSPQDILYEYDVRFPGMLDMSGADMPLSVLVREKGKQAYRDVPELPRRPAQRRGQQEKKHAEPARAASNSQPFGAVAMPAGLTAQQAAIFSAVQERALCADEIGTATGLPAGELMRILTEMELYGYLEQQPGKRYRAAEE